MTDRGRQRRRPTNRKWLRKTAICGRWDKNPQGSEGTGMGLFGKKFFYYLPIQPEPSPDPGVCGHGIEGAGS
jgi:hypothetical protein